MSAAVVAFGGTATPDWVLLVATSEGDGAGAVTACCWVGWTVDWVESAAIRAAAALFALSLAGVLALVLSAFAILCFFGTGALASFTGAAGAGAFSAAAGGVAGILASGGIAAGCGAGAGWTRGDTGVAPTTALG